MLQSLLGAFAALPTRADNPFAPETLLGGGFFAHSFKYSPIIMIVSRVIKASTFQGCVKGGCGEYANPC